MISANVSHEFVAVDLRRQRLADPVECSGHDSDSFGRVDTVGVDKMHRDTCPFDPALQSPI
jgi:hypothetical protein